MTNFLVHRLDVFAQLWQWCDTHALWGVLDDSMGQSWGPCEKYSVTRNSPSTLQITLISFCHEKTLGVDNGFVHCTVLPSSGLGNNDPGTKPPDRESRLSDCVQRQHKH